MTESLPASARIGLTENQARRILSGVRTLRESLAELLRSVSPSDTEEALGLIEHDLSSSEIQRIHVMAQHLAKEIDALAVCRFS